MAPPECGKMMKRLHRDVRFEMADRPHVGGGLQPRANGTAALTVKARGPVTCVEDLRQSGALKLVFPRTHRPDAEVVLVNTAGGITGGDRLNMAATVGEGATLTLTTQAAERVYRAASGRGEVTTVLTVAAGAVVRWLPQETILFDQSALRRRFRADLTGDASLLLVEPLVFGRAAMGEVVRRFDLDDRVAIWRDGVPAYLDGTRLRHGDDLQNKAIAGGARAAAQLVLAAPDAALQRDTVRALLPATAGASALGPDVLVMRVVAPDSFALRQTLLPLLDHLTNHSLPACWRL